MNSSFSKKRHLAEANSILESRFIKDRLIESRNVAMNEQADFYESPQGYAQRIANAIRQNDAKGLMTILNVIATYKGANFLYQIYNAYNQLYGVDLGQSIAKLPKFDTRFRGSTNLATSYVNNALKKIGVELILTDSNGIPTYAFKFPENAKIKPISKPDENTKQIQTNTSNSQVNNNMPGVSANQNINSGPKFKDCSKLGVYQFGCMDSRPKEQNEIIKIQGCIGVKQDGYFGRKTMIALNNKFPNLGGIVRVGDINTICQSQITPVGLSGDNDMDSDPKYKSVAPEIKPVPNTNNQTQPPEDWVETPQTAPTQPEQPKTPLDPAQKNKLTDKYTKLGQQYSKKRAEILKKNPSATEDQVKQQLK